MEQDKLAMKIERVKWLTGYDDQNQRRLSAQLQEQQEQQEKQEQEQQKQEQIRQPFASKQKQNLDLFAIWAKIRRYSVCH